MIFLYNILTGKPITPPSEHLWRAHYATLTCSQNKYRTYDYKLEPVEVLTNIRDIQTAHISNNHTAIQVLTKNGIQYVNPSGLLQDTFPNRSFYCEDLFIHNYTIYSLMYSKGYHAVFLIKAAFDPLGYDDDFKFPDSIQFTQSVDSARLIDFPNKALTTGVELYKDGNKFYDQLLITYERDKEYLSRLAVQNDSIVVLNRIEFKFDSLAYSKEKSPINTAIYMHNNMYGLLPFQTKAEYLKIEPFEYHYARAQHRSGVWGYLKNDGTWFPDEK